MASVARFLIDSRRLIDSRHPHHPRCLIHPCRYPLVLSHLRVSVHLLGVAHMMRRVTASMARRVVVAACALVVHSSSRFGNSRGLLRRLIVVARPGRVKGAVSGALREGKRVASRSSTLDPPRPGHQFLFPPHHPRNSVRGKASCLPVCCRVAVACGAPWLLVVSMKPGGFALACWRFAW